MTKTTANPDRQERRLVYMSAAQLAQVKALAKRTGTTQADIYRRAIDVVIRELSSKRGRKA